MSFTRLSILGLATVPLVAVLMGMGSPDPDTIEYPDGVPPSAQEVELGKTLFFDQRLSATKGMSCASCHNPDLGFSDGLAKGLGAHGNRLGRNAPHLYNLAWSKVLFWDGRAGSLEEQALGPIQAAGEMDMKLPDVLGRLQEVAWYRDRFAAVYPDGITAANIGKAIAAFERTLISKDSPFDRRVRGDEAAMSEEAKRGQALFEGKAGCVNCHSGANFTDDSFHDLGMAGDDIGRAKIAPGATAQKAFKTPGLRNATLTGPYMHDGSVRTLEDVVQFYNRGGDVPSPDPLVKKLGLTDREVLDLVAFLGALTDPIRVERPSIP